MTPILVTGAHAHTLEPASARLANLTIAGDRFADSGAASPTGVDVSLDGWCLLPGLSDSHVHQIEATQDLDTVSLARARSIADVIELINGAAASTPAGSWIVSGRGWLESRLSEGRLPTTDELDLATTEHPVMIRRGSHLGVLNTHALRIAGDTAERDEHGKPTGLIRGAESIRHLIEEPAASSIEARAAALERICALHASRGLVGARDAGIDMNDLDVYLHLDLENRLRIRTDLLIRIAAEMEQWDKLTLLDDLGPPPEPRGDFLRVNGIKLYADGRIDDAAMRDPYPARGDHRGVLHMDSDQVAAVAGRAVGLGWRVGTHVVGDRALDAVLDGYEAVISENPDLPGGWLTIEHALVADAAQQRRAADLGVGVTVQHPLVDWYSASIIEQWGSGRAVKASPVRGWLEAEALVAAGSDGHVTPFDPLRSIAGMATRQTVDSGILGAEQRISLESAFRLYSVDANWLSAWRTPKVGFSPGAFADFVAFPSCVFDTVPEALGSELEPVLTVVGGRASYDPIDIWPDRL